MSTTQPTCRHPSPTTSPNLLTLPLVDLSPFTTRKSTSTPAERLQTARDLVAACKSIGFVYVTNHGVPQDVVHEAFALSKNFFDLPTEVKMKAPHPPGWTVHRGYSWPGLEKVSAALSENSNDDEKVVTRLREVRDCKVRLFSVSDFPLSPLVF